MDVTVVDEPEPGTLALSATRPRLGVTLTATLTDPDGVTGTVAYVWERSVDRGTWVTLTNTAAAYVTTAADTGRFLRGRRHLPRRSRRRHRHCAYFRGRHGGLVDRAGRVHHRLRHEPGPCAQALLRRRHPALQHRLLRLGRDDDPGPRPRVRGCGYRSAGLRSQAARAAQSTWTPTARSVSRSPPPAAQRPPISCGASQVTWST